MSYRNRNGEREVTVKSTIIIAMVPPGHHVHDTGEVDCKARVTLYGGDYREQEAPPLDDISVDAVFLCERIERIPDSSWRRGYRVQHHFGTLDVSEDLPPDVIKKLKEEALDEWWALEGEDAAIQREMESPDWDRFDVD